MKVYKILVEETRGTVIEVSAESESEAEALATRQYDNGQVLLEPADISEVIIREVNSW